MDGCQRLRLRRGATLALWVAVALVLGACSTAAPTGDGATGLGGADSPGQPSGASAEGTAGTPSGRSGADDEPGRELTPEPGMDRPAVIEVTLTVEGMAEAHRASLFVTPDGWPLSFSTYYPDDWVVDTHLSPEAAVVVFHPAYGGTVEERAVMSAVALPGGTGRDDALSVVADLAAELGIHRIPDENRRHTWSSVEYGGCAAGFISSLALGLHGDTYYYLLVRYPGELADGFAPRQQLVLDQWIWTDTGEPLRFGAGDG